MRRMIWLALLVGLGLGLFIFRVANAQTPAAPSDDQVNQIARELYCPVCENIPLDVCPTQACAQWREQIRTMLAQGKTKQEIKDYFVQQYGDRVVGVPPAKGANLLVYIVPPVAILAGIFILYRVFRAWRSMPPPLTVEEQALDSSEDDDEYIRRLENELRKR